MSLDMAAVKMIVAAISGTVRIVPVCVHVLGASLLPFYAHCRPGSHGLPAGARDLMERVNVSVKAQAVAGGLLVPAISRRVNARTLGYSF